MKIAYFGTPQIAVRPLVGLVEAGHEVELVVTGADARRGRGKALTANPVKIEAVERGLTVTHDPTDVCELADIDLGVVVAFGQILRPPVLGHIPLVNLHFSSLPRWRGAAPVERAILAGDPKIGVCVMAIEAGLDTGGIYAETAVDSDKKSLFELWQELSEVGTGLLLEWMTRAFDGPDLVAPSPQLGEPTYAEKLSKDDRRIDFDRSPNEQLAVIRLGNAWTEISGKRVKILAATISESGMLEVQTIQPEGKRPMPFADWKRGTPAEMQGPLS